MVFANLALHVAKRLSQPAVTTNVSPATGPSASAHNSIVTELASLACDLTSTFRPADAPDVNEKSPREKSPFSNPSIPETVNRRAECAAWVES